MARRTSILVCASVLIGIASIAVAPSAALAKKKAVKAPEAVAAVTPAPAPVLNSGEVASRVPRCFDSVVHYPSAAPCY